MNYAFKRINFEGKKGGNEGGIKYFCIGKKNTKKQQYELKVIKKFFLIVNRKPVHFCGRYWKSKIINNIS